jgi:hypothetical protein
MSDVRVSTGQAAIIEVTDTAVLEEIYQRLQGVDDKTTQVQFRPDVEEIVLVFSDDGEIHIGVQEHMAALNDVASSNGRYFVYAMNPAPETTGLTGGVALMSGGGTNQPPPPDSMCPCGGP